jgi:hypothetical protein
LASASTDRSIQLPLNIADRLRYPTAAGRATGVLGINGTLCRALHYVPLIPATQLRTRSAILDGEIVRLDEQGKPQFENLMFRRSEPSRSEKATAVKRNWR